MLLIMVHNCVLILSFLLSMPQSLEDTTEPVGLDSSFICNRIIYTSFEENPIIISAFPSMVHPPNRGIILGWLWHVMMRQEAKIGNMWPLDPPHIILTSLCTCITNPPLIFRLSSPPHKHFDCCIFLCVFWEYCCVGVCFCGTSKVNNVQRWLPPPNWTWWWQFWRYNRHPPPLLSKSAGGGATVAGEPVYVLPRADGEWCMHQRFYFV